MTRTRTLALALLSSIVAAAGPGAYAAEPAPEADLILSHGEISIPGGGFAAAMAVRSGVILEVGDDAAVAKYKGSGTQVIDLHGAAVVPGLHDMHVHPTGAGLWQARCMFPQGSPAQVVVDTVKGCVGKHARGAWVTGGSWDAASFGKTPPHRALLDKVSPENPVYLNDISAIETLVTRQRPGGGGEVLGAAERITLQQAFDLFTVNSARQMGNRHRTGSIEKGLLADVLVLDRNPYKIPVTDIHDTKVEMTLINGEVVYRAPR